MILPGNKTCTRQPFIDMFANSCLLLDTNIKYLCETSFDGPHAGNSQVLFHSRDNYQRQHLGSLAQIQSIILLVKTTWMREFGLERALELLRKLLNMSFLYISLSNFSRQVNRHHNWLTEVEENFCSYD